MESKPLTATLENYGFKVFKEYNASSSLVDIDLTIDLDNFATTTFALVKPYTNTPFSSVKERRDLLKFSINNLVFNQHICKPVNLNAWLSKVAVSASDLPLPLDYIKLLPFRIDSRISGSSSLVCKFDTSLDISQCVGKSVEQVRADLSPSFPLMNVFNSAEAKKVADREVTEAAHSLNNLFACNGVEQLCEDILEATFSLLKHRINVLQ